MLCRVNESQVLKIEWCRSHAVLTSLYALVLFTGLMISNVYVHGKQNLESKKHWGYLLSCNHVLYIHGVTVTKCTEECLYRMHCESVNYIVHHKYCELCANEEISGNIRRNGGVFIKRREMKQEMMVKGCSLSDEERCPDNKRSSVSVNKECGKPPMPDPWTQIQGNLRKRGSRIKYFCDDNGYRYNYDQSTCQENGTWTVPNQRCSAWVYKGCYSFINGVVHYESGYLWDELMTIEQCKTYCVENVYTLFILLHGNECHCGSGSSLPEPLFWKIDENQCNLPCFGNVEQICGGFAEEIMIRVPTGLDPDHPPRYESSDLDPNCLHRLCKSPMYAKGLTQMTSLVALQSTDNGDCLYNSFSIYLAGYESRAAELRYRCCLEMVTNRNQMLRHRLSKDLEHIPPNLDDSCLECTKIGEGASTWNILALSNLLRVKVTVLYPAVNGPDDIIFKNMNQTFCPPCIEPDKPGITIMWSSVRAPPKNTFPRKPGTKWVLNHFVPLVSTTQPVQTAELPDKPDEDKDFSNTAEDPIVIS